MGRPSDLVQGTLDLLILRTIQHEPKHGWAIAKRIQPVSKDVLKVQQGSLRPALYRLEKGGGVAGRRAAAQTGREAKFCSLTSSGRAHLQREVAAWERLSGAIDLVGEEA